LRVLILANNDVGLYRFRFELLQALRAAGHEVFISLPPGDLVKPLQVIGCVFLPTPFDRRGMNPLRELGLLLRYLRLLRRHRPDAVLTYTIKPNIFGGLACRLRRVPYLANITGLGTAMEGGGAKSRLLFFLYRLGLKGAGCVFFQNARNREVFERVLRPGAHSRLLPGSGVNLQRFTPLPYPGGEEGTRFLFIGRVMGDKGVNELLAAMARVKAAHPTASLTLLGGCDEAYEEVLAQHQQSGLITWKGHVNEVLPYIKACHCLVLPSYHEGTANVLLEAAASARPVIATRVPGCQETFDEGVSGLGCEPRDVDSLAQAMLAFMDLTQDSRRAMGLAGRKKMEKEYDRGIVVKAYCEELNRILA